MPARQFPNVPVRLPPEVLTVYQRARSCFIELEELDGENHRGGLLLFRDALQELIQASEALTLEEEAVYVASAVDALGKVATCDFESLTMANLETAQGLHDRRLIRSLFRRVGSRVRNESGIVEVRTALGMDTPEYGNLTERSRGAEEWTTLSDALEGAHSTSVRVRRELEDAPSKVVLGLVALLGACVTALLLALVLAH